MMSILSMLITALLATITTAAALNTATEFDVTDLSISRIIGGNVTFSFTLHDPYPVGLDTQVCGGTWVSGSKAYPTAGYEPCGNSTMAWRMNSFTSIADFELGTEHFYQDPSMGDPPFDQVANYATVKINRSNHPCRTMKGVKTCTQPSGTVITAPIVSTSS